VLRFFMRRTFDPEVAADLTAETFAEALASSAKTKTVTDPGAWVFGIAHHQLSRYLRRGAVADRARRRLSIAVPQLSGHDHDLVWSYLDRDELSEPLADALAQLPDGQRDAVRLRVVDEPDYDQIGERLGCSPDSARARVSRGLRSLSALMAPNPHTKQGINDGL
jgi:RNA polymerase sigma factor (sigma-70 family)